MSMILITAKFKFRNRSTRSKEPMKRAGKVCGDSQDLKSPGYCTQPIFCGADAITDKNSFLKSYNELLIKLRLVAGSFVRLTYNLTDLQMKFVLR